VECEGERGAFKGTCLVGTECYGAYFLNSGQTKTQKAPVMGPCLGEESTERVVFWLAFLFGEAEAVLQQISGVLGKRSLREEN